jgi:tyrosine-protein kinase Fer
MGFGTELQGQQSHVALLNLQEAELRLLESVKKCVTQRIKCDRDYAMALTNMVNTAQKLDSSLEFNSPTFLVITFLY